MLNNKGWGLMEFLMLLLVISIFFLITVARIYMLYNLIGR